MEVSGQIYVPAAWTQQKELGVGYLLNRNRFGPVNDVAALQKREISRAYLESNHDSSVD